MSFCSSCGRELDQRDRFCFQCGARVREGIKATPGPEAIQLSSMLIEDPPGSSTSIERELPTPRPHATSDGSQPFEPSAHAAPAEIRGRRADTARYAVAIVSLCLVVVAVTLLEATQNDGRKVKVGATEAPTSRPDSAQSAEGSTATTQVSVVPPPRTTTRGTVPLTAPRVERAVLSQSRSQSPPYQVDMTYQRLVEPGDAAVREIDNVLAAALDAQVKSFEISAASDTMSTGSPSTFDGTLDVDLLNTDLASFSLSDYYLYGGAAIPGYFTQTFNFSLATGSLLGLDDLFSSQGAGLSKLSALSRTMLPKVLGSMANTSWINSGTTPTEANFALWAAEPQGLTITFRNEQVSAGATGQPSIVIPWTQLAGVISPKGPFRQLLAGHT